MATKAQIKRKLERLDKSGRGTGWGPDYRALICVHEMVSVGLAHRLVVWRYGRREFNLFSDAEKAAFLWHWFRPDTVEIYDQVKCDRAGTLAIARQLGVQHPQAIRGEPTILSTDLLVVRRTPRGFRERAISVKHEGYRLKDDDRKSLHIQQLYHLQRGREWRFCSSAGLNSAWARNLQWLFPAAEHVDRGKLTIGEIAAEEALLTEMRRPHFSAAEAQRAATARFDLAPTAAAGAFRRLIATHVLAVDINAPAFERLPPSAFRITRPAGNMAGISDV
jgi:hypothetical protein